MTTSPHATTATAGRCTCGRTFATMRGLNTHLTAAAKREANIATTAARVARVKAEAHPLTIAAAGRDDAAALAALTPAERATITARAAALDALPTDDEPAGEPVEVDAPAAVEVLPGGGELRQTEHGARYLTADEVAAEQAAEPRVADSDRDAADDRTGAPVLRKVGEGLYEVVLDGRAIGRVARTTPAHVTLGAGARWASYTTTGTRLGSGHTSRRAAAARVVEHAAPPEVGEVVDGFAVTARTHPAGCGTCDRLVLDAVAQARVTGSVGCTYSDNRLGDDLIAVEVHEVTVDRQQPLDTGDGSPAAPGARIVSPDLAARHGLTRQQLTAVVDEVLDEALADGGPCASCAEAIGDHEPDELRACERAHREHLALWA